MKFTEDPNFVTYVELSVGDSKLDVYTILPPTIFPLYCPILRYDVINLIDDQGVGGTGAVYLASSCNGVYPCDKLDLLKNDIEQTLTFKI